MNNLMALFLCYFFFLFKVRHICMFTFISPKQLYCGRFQIVICCYHIVCLDIVSSKTVLRNRFSPSLLLTSFGRLFFFLLFFFLGRLEAGFEPVPLVKIF